MSTSMVPPQQPAWWARAVRAHSPPLWRLPNKIWEKIVRIVEYDQSFTQDEGGTGGSESMELRDEFVQEREGFQDRHTKAMMEYLQWDLEPRGG